MKYFVIFSLFIGLSGLATAQVFADGDYTEFIIDGYVITANSTYVTDISLDWDSPSLPLGNITLKEPFTGTIEIQIPKSMPRTMNLDFDTRFLLEIKNDDINDHLIDDNNTLYDDRITETESLCNYILTIKLENTEYFEFGTLSVATGRWEPVTIQNEECDDVSDETTFQNGSVFPRHGYHGWAIPPLKQFKSGISLDKIECRESLVLVTKHDGTPACVSYETGNKMIERGWGICSDLVSYDRGNPCGPHSSEVVSFDSYKEIAPSNDPTDSFPQQYDAVIEGSIQICMGHKGYPIRYQCEIQVDSYIKFDGQRTEKFTTLAYNATLIPEWNTKAVFGLNYHPDENYYEIVETGFSRK